jgi:PAS domain S-box-containing protein
MIVRRWLVPPVFTADEYTRIARLLHWLLLTTMIINIANVFFLSTHAPHTLSTFWVNLMLFLITVILFGVMRIGYVYTVSFILCLSIWASITYTVVILGGISTPSAVLFSTVIVAGGILLGTRGAIGMGILCIVTLNVVYWLGQRSLIPAPLYESDSSHWFSSHVSSLMALTVLVSISANSVMTAIQRARHGEAVLAERNRQLQQEIREREQAQKEQARLVAILEATSDLVGMIDTEGKLLYLNPSGRKLLLLPDDCDIHTVRVAQLHPPDTMEIIRTQALPTLIKDGLWAGETVLVNQEGGEIPSSQVVIAHYDTSGHVERFSAVVRDISEQKQAEQQRLELAVQKERLETFKEFLGNVSHDLRAPMTVINIGLDLLTRIEDPIRRKEKVKSLQEQVMLLERYIQDLLTLTHLDRAPQLEMESVDLNLLLTDLCDNFQLVAEKKSQTFTFQLTPSLLHINGDMQELHRAVANLLENAINYTPNEGTVLLKSVQLDNEVMIEVTDTGIGIDAAGLQHIFERFYRTDDARKYRHDGTGLGLAIVKRIVEIHDGRIEVQSEVGKGTTFRIWLPLLAEPVTA